MPSVLNCCPVPALEAVPYSECGFNIAQIVEVMFANPAANPIFANAAALGTAANITAGVAANKLKPLPIVNAATITAGDQVEIYGVGTNDTAYGYSQLSQTNNPSVFAATMYNLTADQVAAIRQIICLGGYEVYFKTSTDTIIYRDNSGAVAGFPVRAIGFKSVQVDGLNTTDKYMITFQLQAFWEEDALTTTPVDYAFQPWISL